MSTSTTASTSDILGAHTVPTARAKKQRPSDSQSETTRPEATEPDVTDQENPGTTDPADPPDTDSASDSAPQGDDETDNTPDDEGIDDAQAPPQPASSPAPRGFVRYFVALGLWFAFGITGWLLFGWKGAVAVVVLVPLLLRLFGPLYRNRTSSRPVPVTGWRSKAYRILNSKLVGIPYVPKLNKAVEQLLYEEMLAAEAEAAQAAQAEAEQDEFDTLGTEINTLIRELVMEKKSNLVIMAQNQAGTASKTWATTWLSSELAKTCRYDIAYVEVRDGTAFGTDILGVPRNKTVDTKALLDHEHDIGPSGNLDRYANRSPHGVYGITTRSKQDGKPLSREEGTKSLKIVIDRASVTFIDPGNTPVSEFNLAACDLTHVHLLVCAPNLVAADNLAVTIEELDQQGVDITPQNAFAMFNGWRSETPEDWRGRLGLAENFELLGTAYDPGADITSLSQGIGANFTGLRVHLKRITLRTRIELRRVIVKALRLRLAQLNEQGSPSAATTAS